MTALTVFDDVKRLVSTRDAVEYYGFTPNRSGFVCCPFHQEKTPSLKLYSNGGWHCFGCNQGGSVVDFVMKLFDLSPLDAVKRLNEDFRLGLPLDKPQGKAERAAALQRREKMDTLKEYASWKGQIQWQLADAYRLGHLAVKYKHPDTWTDAEVLAVKWMPALEDWYFSLDSSRAEQLAVLRDRMEVEQLCNQISPIRNWQKSDAA